MAAASLHGVKYADLNCNGVMDGSDFPLANWIITLSNWSSQIDEDTTDALGQYDFDSLPTGYYIVSEVVQPGWVQTAPTTVSHYPVLWNMSQSITGLDFGNFSKAECSPVTTDTCLAGKIDDFDNADGPEPSSPDSMLAALSLEYCGNSVSLFDNTFPLPLPPHCFGHTFSDCWDTTCCLVDARLCMRLKAVGPTSFNDNFRITTLGYALPPFAWDIPLNKLLQFATGGVDSFWTFGDTMTVCLNLDSLPSIGGQVTNVLAALQTGKLSIWIFNETAVDYLQLMVDLCCDTSEHLCSISGTKFFDIDKDGFHDGGEPGLPNWTINLYFFGGPLYATTTTDAFGNYTFANIPCSSYTVQEVVQSGWVQTYPSPNTHSFSLAPGGGVGGIDFGNWFCGQTDDTCCVRAPAKMIAWYPLDETVTPIAYDVASGTHNGLDHCSTMTFTTGKVDGAYQFGFPYWVDVFNDPFVQIGAGDFTIDCWAKPTTLGNGCQYYMPSQGVICVDPIIDNRRWMQGGAGNDGICFFLYHDSLTSQRHVGLIMQQNPNVPNVFLSPPLPITLGNWQHFAVTVSRTGTPVGRFYYNGVAIGAFTPISGPLFSGAPGPRMQIAHGTFLSNFGCGHGCGGQERYFGGALDEIEIFSQALPASEVLRVFAAGSSGKCKVRCRIPSVVPFCITQSQATATMTICNNTGVSASFNWSLAGQASGTGCNFNGTGMTFSPGNGVTPILAPGQCTNITYVINRPSGFSYPSVACYSLTVLDPVSGASTTCHGTIKATKLWCAIKHIPSDVIPLKVGQTQLFTFSVRNDEDSSGLLRYRVVARSHDEEDTLPAQVVSLNGLPPGIPVEGTRMIGLGDSSDVNVEVSLVDAPALEFFDIVYEIDLDGDSKTEPVTAAGVKPEAFSDCNRNGVDDIIDIAQGTSFDANGDGVPDECQAQCTTARCTECYLCGDANNNGIVNIADVVYLIQYIFGGGPVPIPLAAGDTNCNSIVNIADAVYLIQYIFGGGPIPCRGCF